MDYVDLSLMADGICVAVAVGPIHSSETPDESICLRGRIELILAYPS